MINKFIRLINNRKPNLMDQLVQQVNQEKSQILQCSFPIKWQDKTYTTSLSVADHRLEICITQEDQYLFQWKEKYSVNQFYKIHEFFLQLKNLQQFYEIFQKLMKNSVLSISLKDSRMIVQFEFEQLIGKTKFDIQLIQCEMNSKDVNLKMNQKIVNLEINHQKQLEQIIKDNQGQTEQIKNLSNQIEQMKDCFIKNIEVLNLDHQNQIQKLQNESNSQKQFPCSDIITQDEQEIVKKWISDKQISLKLIYKATINGFQIKKIYEQCKNKSKVVLLKKLMRVKGLDFMQIVKLKFIMIIQFKILIIFSFFLLIQNKNILQINLIVLMHFIHVVAIWQWEVDMIQHCVPIQIAIIILMLKATAMVKKKDLENMLQMEELKILQQVKYKYLKQFDINQQIVIYVERQSKQCQIYIE
ncbi:hypothetical protein ABPG72_004472 [Tetrahymena utriculariae]